MKQAILVTQKLEDLNKNQFVNALQKLFSLSENEAKQVDLVFSEKGINLELKELIGELKLSGLNDLANKLDAVGVYGHIFDSNQGEIDCSIQSGCAGAGSFQSASMLTEEITKSNFVIRSFNEK